MDPPLFCCWCRGHEILKKIMTLLPQKSKPLICDHARQTRLSGSIQGKHHEITVNLLFLEINVILICHICILYSTQSIMKCYNCNRVRYICIITSFNLISWLDFRGMMMMMMMMRLLSKSSTSTSVPHFP